MKIHDEGSSRLRSRSVAVVLGVLIAILGWALWPGGGSTEADAIEPTGGGVGTPLQAIPHAPEIASDDELVVPRDIETRLTPDEAGRIALDLQAQPRRGMVRNNRPVKVLSVMVYEATSFPQMNTLDPEGQIGPLGERLVWLVETDALFHKPRPGGTISGSTTHYGIDDSTGEMLYYGTGSGSRTP